MSGDRTNTLLTLARIWRKRGKTSRAADYYRQILADKGSPQELEAVLIELIDLLMAEEDWQGIKDTCKLWLKDYPDNASHKYSNQVHKLYINALVRQDDIDAAFMTYGLVRKDTKTIEIAKNELICCVTVRNERPRLTYFLEYYRRQGITKFLIADNDSTDDTQAYLLTQPDVYTWHTAYSYRAANCGAAWWELLLRRYAIGHWVVVVDADELLYYPECEDKTIPQLCLELDSQGKTALRAIQVDMYADRPIQETNYETGKNFLSSCSYFDRQFFQVKRPMSGAFNNMTNYCGGVRSRVFGGNFNNYILNKIPLFKYHIDDVLTSGQHWLQRPQEELSIQRGALLHFKYFASFQERVRQETTRQEMARKGSTYQPYVDKLVENQALTLYDPLHSIRYENSLQLIQLGIMQSHKNQNHAEFKAKNTYFPAIAAYGNLLATTLRPFFSIAIVAGDRNQCLERTVKSVLTQLSSKEEVQIEIIFDRTSRAISQEIESIVAKVNDSRLQIHASERYLGFPNLLTLCLERAKGEWVHILSGDDWLYPGFYQVLKNRISSQPNIGAAFCRFDYGKVEDRGTKQDIFPLSPLESQNSGILEDWLPRIITQNRVAFSSMVVKQAAYAEVGGFCLAARSAAKWEMCQRLALHFPIWYETEVLAHSAGNPLRIKYQDSFYGQPLADALSSIDIAMSYLPTEISQTCSQQARNNIALQGIEIAKTHLKQGRYLSAMANLGEGLQGNKNLSPDVQQSLTATLTGIIE